MKRRERETPKRRSSYSVLCISPWFRRQCFCFGQGGWGRLPCDKIRTHTSVLFACLTSLPGLLVIFQTARCIIYAHPPVRKEREADGRWQKHRARRKTGDGHHTNRRDGTRLTNRTKKKRAAALGSFFFQYTHRRAGQEKKGKKITPVEHHKSIKLFLSFSSASLMFWLTRDSRTPYRQA